MPSNTTLCSVTTRHLKGGETQYKIKKSTKMEEIVTDHANRNRRFTTPAYLQFPLDGDNINAHQTSSLLNLDVNNTIDCCPTQRGIVSEDVPPPARKKRQATKPRNTFRVCLPQYPGPWPPPRKPFPFEGRFQQHRGLHLTHHQKRIRNNLGKVL